MTQPVQPYIPKREVEADNIIFDFGGVMMQHDREGCVAALNALIGEGPTRCFLGMGQDTEIIPEEYYLQNRWREKSLKYLYERGKISTHDFLARILDYCPDGTKKQQVIDAWNKMHAGVPDAVWLQIRALRRKGYRTFLFSNTNELHWQHTLSLYKDKIDLCFDSVFLSYEMGLCKPNPAAYRHVDYHIGAIPSRTCFIDDKEINRLAAQQAVGWSTCASIAELTERTEEKKNGLP